MSTSVFASSDMIVVFHGLNDRVIEISVPDSPFETDRRVPLQYLVDRCTTEKAKVKFLYDLYMFFDNKSLMGGYNLATGSDDEIVPIVIWKDLAEWHDDNPWALEAESVDAQ